MNSNNNYPFLTHSSVGSLYEGVLLDAVRSVYLAPYYLKQRKPTQVEEGREDWRYLHTFTPSSYCFSFYIISHMFGKEPEDLSHSIEKHLKNSWGKEGVLPYAKAIYSWK